MALEGDARVGLSEWFDGVEPVAGCGWLLPGDVPAVLFVFVSVVLAVTAAWCMVAQ